MGSERIGVLLTAAIVVLLLGATVAVFAFDPESRTSTSPPPDGRVVFLTKGCTACHSVEGASMTGQIGPDLTRLAERAGDRVEGLSAEDYVRRSVLDPQAFIVDGYGPMMPTLPIDVAELDALVEFLLETG